MLEGGGLKPPLLARTPDAETLRDSGEKRRAKQPELKCQMPELKTPDCSHAKRSDTQIISHSGQRATATDRRAKGLRPVAKDARAKAQNPGAKDARADAHELIYTICGDPGAKDARADLNELMYTIWGNICEKSRIYQNSKPGDCRTGRNS